MFNISQFITDTYYVLTAPNNTDPCDEISITVSGYNGAGNGEMTIISSPYFPTGDYYRFIKGHSRSPWPQRNVHNFSLE